MRRELFYLYSTLPPAELKDRLDLEVRVQNNLHQKELKIALKWKNEGRFTAYMMDYGDGFGIYRSMGARHKRVSLSAGFWESKSVGYSPVYCGQIAPDGAGSVIFGHFRQPLWAWLVCIVLLYGVGFLSCAMTGQYWIYLIALVLGIPMFRDFVAPQRTRPAGELWEALEYLLETVDGLAIEEAKAKENKRDKE